MVSINERLPDYHDFLWVWRASKTGPELAYFSASLAHWQDPYSVGDSEGLSVEYFNDVTHWQDLLPPDKAPAITEKKNGC